MKRTLPSDELSQKLLEHQKLLEEEGFYSLFSMNADSPVRDKKISFETMTELLPNIKALDLREYDLSDLDLRHYDLSYCILQGCNLQNSDLSHIKIRCSDLKKAKFNSKDTLLIGTDLLGSDASNADFSYANLTKAKIGGMNLDSAKFCHSNLSELWCRAINTQGANMTSLLNADFTSALLVGSKFHNIENASVAQFAGLDLANVYIESKNFENGILNCTEAARKAHNLFLFLLTICSYFIFCICTVTDASLINESSTLPLPILGSTIIGSSISFNAFYKYAPFLLLIIFIYFHIYLQNFFENLGNLPAILPTGEPIPRLTYPWLITGIMYLMVAPLKPFRSPLSLIRSTAYVALCWFLVPFVLGIIWNQYLPMHDLKWNSIKYILLCSSIILAVYFLAVARFTLQNKIKLFSPLRFGIASFLFGIGVASLFYLLISITPTSLDLVNVELSQKPLSWNGTLETIKGIRLIKRDLSYANMERAFLINAAFNESNLTNANLFKADLRGAHFSKAKLINANLLDANIAYADFRDAIGLTAKQLCIAKGIKLASLPKEFSNIDCKKINLLINS